MRLLGGVPYIVEVVPDPELVARARGGDEVAFATLVHRHYDDCLRFGTRMLGDRADAEDALQETLIRAYRSLDRYDERSRFRPWLLAILANRCRSMARRRSWRISRLREWFSPDLHGRNGASVELADVHHALAGLPARLREAFLLKHVEDLTYEEMKHVTGASESALKMRVKRACEALAQQLRELDG